MSRMQSLLKIKQKHHVSGYGFCSGSGDGYGDGYGDGDGDGYCDGDGYGD